MMLCESIDDLTRQIRKIACQNDVARRLMTMPGIGPVTAVSIAVLSAPPEMFSKGRDLAAWIGLAPRQHSTGGNQHLLIAREPMRALSFRSMEEVLAVYVSNIIMRKFEPHPG